MKVQWHTYASVNAAARAANAIVVQALGLPYHKGAGRLAIVGGGPSIADHVAELQAWDGEIWAVNGTINWCLDHQIDAAFFTIDAQPRENWTYDLTRIRRAVMACDCDPGVIAKLVAHGAKVSLLPEPDGGPTSAAASDLLSLQAGYTEITYFGCEANFGDSTHAFASHPIGDWIVVEIGGEQFRTKPEYVQQAEIMSEVIRSFPSVYSEKSGGLLRAMVQHGPEHDVCAVSNALLAQIKKNFEAEAA